MDTPLHVLIVDDSETDAALIVRHLERGGYAPVHARVETAMEMKASLKNKPWDIIIADYKMPRFNAPAALNILKGSGLDVPFIVVSGTIGEVTAVAMMKAGAHDYLMKDNLTRLAPAIERELKEAQVRRERAHAEKALREKEARIQSIIRAAPTGIAVVKNRVLLEVNTRFCNMLGYSENELIGNSTRLLYPTDDDFNHVSTGLYNQLEKRGTASIETRFRHKDGRIMDVLLSSTMITPSDTYPELNLTVLDMTERKRAEEALRESEQRYRILAENASDIIWTLDLNLRFTFISPSVEKQQGWTVEEFKSLSLKDILTPDSFDRAIKVFQEESSLERNADIDPKRSRMLELVQYRKDGSTIWIEVTASFLRDGEGNAIGMLGISRNITERKKLETRVRQAQKMEAIGTLAGGIAHDFNNILGAIMGYTDLALTNHTMDDHLRRYIERVHQAGERARDLVKQILTFSRQTEQERKPVQVAPIMKEVLKLLRSSLPTTIEIHQDLSTPPGGNVVLADPTQIHQVLMNLCTNAAHAMRAKGGILTVIMSEVEVDANLIVQCPDLKPGSYVKLSVSDTGHGMDSAVMERIFEPYFTTKAPGEGTGLGLAVVQGIVKGYGGSISVFSEPGCGTTFHVFLPRIKEKRAPETEAIEGLPTGRERILFVDDEEALVNLGKDMLEFLGYTVTAKMDSLEALEIFRAEPKAFDLVITDMTMPKLTGMELSRECMAIRPDIPCIICTGFSEMNENLIKDTGICEVVLKPFITSKIAKTIRKVLEKK